MLKANNEMTIQSRIGNLQEGNNPAMMQAELNAAYFIANPSISGRTLGAIGPLSGQFTATPRNITGRAFAPMKPDRYHVQ